MPKGIVKWFNNAKGFGFIVTEESKDDIFAHYSAIQMDGFRTLKAGQTVDFDLIQADKGWHAANIQVHTTAQPSKPDASTPEPARQNKQNSEPASAQPDAPSKLHEVEEEPI